MDIVLAVATGATEDWKVAVTKCFSIGWGILKRAQDQHLCLAMIGTTGFGKSQVAKRYRREKPNVVYVQCTRDMTKGGFADAILADMGIAPQHRGARNELKIFNESNLFKSIVS